MAGLQSQRPNCVRLQGCARHLAAATAAIRAGLRMTNRPIPDQTAASQLRLRGPQSPRSARQAGIGKAVYAATAPASQHGIAAVAIELGLAKFTLQSRSRSQHCTAFGTPDRVGLWHGVAPCSPGYGYLRFTKSHSAHTVAATASPSNRKSISLGADTRPSVYDEYLGLISNQITVTRARSLTQAWARRRGRYCWGTHHCRQQDRSESRDAAITLLRSAA